jgi:hypothetical protein
MIEMLGFGVAVCELWERVWSTLKLVLTTNHIKAGFAYFILEAWINSNVRNTTASCKTITFHGNTTCLRRCSIIECLTKSKLPCSLKFSPTSLPIQGPTQQSHPSFICTPCPVHRDSSIHPWSRAVSASFLLQNIQCTSPPKSYLLVLIVTVQNASFDDLFPRVPRKKDYVDYPDPMKTSKAPADIISS